MTTIERMLLVAPVRLLRVPGSNLYRCEGTVDLPEARHAIGTGYTPFAALSGAWLDATTRGWVTP